MPFTILLCQQLPIRKSIMWLGTKSNKNVQDLCIRPPKVQIQEIFMPNLSYLIWKNGLWDVIIKGLKMRRSSWIHHWTLNPVSLSETHRRTDTQRGRWYEHRGGDWSDVTTRPQVKESLQPPEVKTVKEFDIFSSRASKGSGALHTFWFWTS